MTSDWPTKKQVRERQKEIEREVGHIVVNGQNDLTKTVQERYTARRKRLFPHIHFKD